jgi:serine/threonine protein kinase
MANILNAVAKIFLNEAYTVIKCFEPGQEGTCSVVRSRKTGKVFVVKKVQDDTSKNKNSSSNHDFRPSLPNEVQMLQRCRKHTNIVRFLDIEKAQLPGDVHSIYLEYCSGGDLLQQLQKFERLGVKTPEMFLTHVISGLIEALAFLHRGIRYRKGKWSMGIWAPQTMIHGDIKPDNILLRWPGTECDMPDIVLADFGQARLASKNFGIVGTPGWEAPEVRRVVELEHSDPQAYKVAQRTRVQNSTSDIYQLGLVIHYMATGREFEIGDDTSEITLLPGYEKVKGLNAFIVWCLQTDPEERPNCGFDEDGCILTAELMRRQRDRMFKRDGAVDRRLWNVLEVK